MPADMTMFFETDDQKWAAVVANVEIADGIFWYGVSSTNIVCKPSCPSKTPNRENVQFFDNVSIAIQHGFRACKRCAP